jgi:hypothetical protein
VAGLGCVRNISAYLMFVTIFFSFGIEIATERQALERYKPFNDQVMWHDYLLIHHQGVAMLEHHRSFQILVYISHILPLVLLEIFFVTTCSHAQINGT